jgi:hypothetical protein
VFTWSVARGAAGWCWQAPTTQLINSKVRAFFIGTEKQMAREQPRVFA